MTFSQIEGLGNRRWRDDPPGSVGAATIYFRPAQPLALPLP
jgi:hypothetical protein